MPKRGPPKDYALFGGVNFRAPAAGAAGGGAAAADPAPPAASIRSELSGALLPDDPAPAARAGSYERGTPVGGPRS